MVHFHVVDSYSRLMSQGIWPRGVSIIEGLRVLFVYGGFPPKPIGQEDGGADYLGRLTSALAQRNIECHVLTSCTPLQPAPFSPEPNVHVWPVVRDWRLRSIRAGEARRVREIVLQTSPHVVHLVYPDPFLSWNRHEYSLPFLLKPLFPRVPMVTTFFAFALRGAGLMTLTGLFSLFMFSRKVNITNELLAAQFSRLFPFWQRKLVDIPVGNNLEVGLEGPSPGSPAAVVRAGLDQAYEYIAFFGFVTPDKGVDIALEALRQLRERRPNLRLLLVGGRVAEQRTEYERELFASLGVNSLESAVVSSGFCDDQRALALVRAAHAMVLPFRKNTMGRSSLAYAAAAGMPIITTWQGREVPFLKHLTNAYLVPPSDAGALASGIDAVLSDRGLRDRLSAGAESLARHMSWGHIADEWLQVYGRVVGDL